MPTSGYVRQQDIADKAGVHITTVSLALRGDPRVATATRLRVEEIARQLGYAPDPMLSALTVYRNRSKRERHQGTLAWLSPPSVRNERKRGFNGYLKGAEDRCAELGYKLDLLYFSELGSSRLAGVLRARNIRGLLIPPQAHSRAHLDFDWSEFSSVCFGFTLSWPRLHLITNAQYSSSRLAAHMLRTRGYRRLGFVTTHENNERTDQNFLAGFLSEQQGFPPDDRIPPLVIQGDDSSVEIKFFEAWYRAHLPDVVLYLHPIIPEYLAQLNVGPERCGYASLSLTSRDGSVAGVYQNDPLIGCKAVDFLVDMLHRNERGIPPHRFQFFVESEWVDGKSIRQIAPTRR